VKKKPGGRQKDPTRVRVHLQIRKDLLDRVTRHAEAENRALSRQFEVIVESTYPFPAE
jgi:hypothetical protein